MNAQPNEPEWLEYALREYEYLSKNIDKFDAQRLQIRNWSITVSGALLAVAFSARVALIAYGSVLVALLFFFLEAIYMRIQQEVIERSNYVEALINGYRRTGQLEVSYEFGVSHAYGGNFYLKDLMRVVFRRSRLHITAFHAGLLLIAILGAIVAGLTLPATGSPPSSGPSHSQGESQRARQ